MSQHYSNSKRANDPTALPDVEVFEITSALNYDMKDEDGQPMADGWYWWSCFPGCLPDSYPSGPFDSEAEALADAQSNADEEGFDDQEDGE